MQTNKALARINSRIRRINREFGTTIKQYYTKDNPDTEHLDKLLNQFEQERNAALKHATFQSGFNPNKI